MKKGSQHITVFEYDTIRAGQTYNGVDFNDAHFNALAKYHTKTHGQYFDLGHNRITFKEFVGVIRVGQLVIEVLPKADRNTAGEDVKEQWKKMLISMLRTVGLFDIHAPSSTSLKIKTNSILDLYFELYITEVEYLLHHGLSKKYRKTEGNCTTLRGSILFSKHIQQNPVHQERAYVRYTVYDNMHQLHFVLYKALRLLKQINSRIELHSRIGALLLHFPEMPDMRVSEGTFQKLVLNKKTSHYQKAMEMARLLLLNYHPDISKGGNHVLALMFDMNLLWEKFVLSSIRKGFKERNDVHVRGQVSKQFWQPDKGSRASIRPDIVIESDVFGCVVLDTKWKNLGGLNPSPGDLRQMYVYHQYYGARKVALVYPGEGIIREGKYFDHLGEIGSQICSLLIIRPEKEMQTWQKSISQAILDWIKRT